MDIQQVKLSEMRPAPYNPREMSAAALKGLERSLERFGYVEPIVWNKRTGNIVGGNHRYKLLQEKGDEEATVVVVDYDEVTEKAANISLNNPGITGTYTGELQPLLDELRVDLPEFEDLQLAELIDPLAYESTEGLTDPDEVPEPPAEPITKRGDVITLGNHRLVCGDATSAEDVDALMQGGPVPLVFTSPPYTDQRTYNIGEFDWDELMNGTTDQIFRVLANPGSAVINLGPSHKDGAVDFYWNDWLARCADQGWPVFGMYVWDKGYGMPGNWNGRLAPTHEFLFHFKQGKIQARKWVESKTIDNGSTKRFRQPDGTLREATSPDKVGQGSHVPDSVVRVHRQSGGMANHPAPFSVEFAEFGIYTWSDVGDVVYDPFGGSGSTMIAAERTGRHGRLMEIDPLYCDIVVNRWENFTGQKAVRNG